MHPRTREPVSFPWRARLVILGIAALAACGDNTTEATESSPLQGLTQAAARDSVGTPRPGNPNTSGPGIVRGTVLGPSNGSGGDTLATAPKVAGARIAAFPVTGGSQASPTLGPEAAFTTTGADGKFTLPSLAAGNYVVTVTPPASSPYAGVWVTSYISAASNEWPWWIVLPRK